MAKVLVLYYSSYGHIAAMADAIAEGARAAGATADVKRVPDLAGTHTARPENSPNPQTCPQGLASPQFDYQFRAPQRPFKPRHSCIVA